MALTEVYSKATGKKVRVPEHFLTHEVFGQQFRKTPLSRAAEEQKSAKPPTKAELQAEIAKRNADRADEDKIVPASEKNDDLTAALAADDDTLAEASDGVNTTRASGDTKEN